MILKVSSTISSDTEDDFNSSTEAKGGGGGAIGLRNAASGTIAASESLTKDLSTAASTDSGLSSQKSSISSTDSDTNRSKYEASSSSEKNPSNDNVTGKSFSEALIFAPVNPQYDKRLFIEFPENYKFITCCVQKLFSVFVMAFKRFTCKYSDLIFAKFSNIA